MTEAVNEGLNLHLADRANATRRVLAEVEVERRHQDALVAAGKFSWNCADPRPPWSEKLAVILEEVGEVGREVVEHIISRDKYAADPQLKVMPPHREKYFRDRLRTELIQVAACCVAWAESLSDKVPTWRSTDPLSPEAKVLLQQELTNGTLYVETDSNVAHDQDHERGSSQDTNEGT